MQCHSDYFSVARVSVWVCMDIGVSTCELARGKVMTGMRQVRWHCQLPVVPHKAVAEVSRIGHYRRD